MTNWKLEKMYDLIQKWYSRGTSLDDFTMNLYIKNIDVKEVYNTIATIVEDSSLIRRCELCKTTLKVRIAPY